MDLKTLKEQLTATEVEFEQAKAHVHRCDGAVQVLRHLVAEEEKAGQVVPEKPVEPKES